MLMRDVSATITREILIIRDISVVTAVRISRAIR